MDFSSDQFSHVISVVDSLLLKLKFMKMVVDDFKVAQNLDLIILISHTTVVDKEAPASNQYVNLSDSRLYYALNLLRQLNPKPS